MYYFKESAFIFIYSLMLSLMSFASLAIEAVWLKYLICILSLLFLFAIIAFNFSKEGEKAYKKLSANDLLRKKIIETGDDIKIDTVTEYKPIKGFLLSFLPFSPMILLLLIHFIIVVAGGETLVLGTISNLLYLDISSLVYLIYDLEVPAFGFFISLYGVVISVLVGGFSYVFGARKIQLQYDKIKEKQKSIYGE